MDDEDMIEDENGLIEPVPENEPEEETPEIREDPKAKSPWKAFILTGLIASLIGAVGGGFGVYEGVKKFAPKPEAQPVVDVKPIQTKLDTLSRRVTDAEASVKKAASRAAPLPDPVDLSGLEARLDALEATVPVDLSGIEERLDTLEAAPAPEIDPAALKALQAAQKDGFEWPDTAELEDRISALQKKVDTAPEPVQIPDNLMKRLKALETEAKANSAAAKASAGEATMASQTKALEKKRMDRIESRLATLETRPAATSPAPRVKRVAILPFPKAAMVQAVEDSEEGGMMKKLLSKHIHVKNEDDPATLIDAMEADMEQGRLREALQKYARLPEPVRAAGQAWHNSVKASL